MLKVTRRHQPPCKRKMWDQGYTKCNCPVLIRGTLVGKRLTLAASKFLPPPFDRDLGRAAELARRWEQAGRVIPLAELESTPEPKQDPSKPEPEQSRTLIWRAISLWLLSSRARYLRRPTLKKYRTFARQLYAYATDRGYVYLDQIRPEDMDGFYSSWKDDKNSKGKKLERMKGFYQWCLKRKYLKENPAEDLEPPVGYSIPNQKTPFTDEHLDRIFEAARNWKNVRWHNAGESGVITSEDVEVFILLEIGTGFAITDAATFHMDRLDAETGECTIRRTKSGKKVNTWLPPELVARLQKLALLRGPQPFLTQSRDPEQAGDAWRERLRKVFLEAGPFPFKATPHIFRHTFVRIHLSRGVPVEDVAELIGDTPEMVRKHYAEWVPERQARLIGVLKDSYRERIERVARVIQMPKQA